ncbi:MAG: nicotinate (nicotinamide) nucleotide adenylyltransferase [Acidobacteriota bacterium]|jgi:nicotinate-nucleotide adenylyltransferase
MKVGVLGGSFDPPHLGHFRLARAAERHLGLDRVLFIPCARQPLKPHPPESSSWHRCAMVALGIEGHPSWTIDTREVERGGISYTAPTLASLHGDFPGSDLFLIIGQDSLESIPRWGNYREVVETAHLAVAPRDPKATVDVPREIAGARVTVLPVTPFPLSATQVRARLCSGKGVRGLVPAAVARYIKKQDLYRSPRSSY